ncbi:DTW domain-containing protein 1 [Entomortierella chlamydospora]|uniref:tRNA-uridine aminocarboxypropyltransferase 1 n=1 Tax=Entomortierella chlamydospora TaxID=101097 RepID=A0A9P6MQF2_9FUNG|nr:DTW domain-containing protein 1 [Entomortierella chlamydospora]
MKECRNLEHLILNVNSIQGLPADLCKAWTRLLNLDLHTNDLKGLPDQLGCMKSLRRLNLAINEIEDIPDSIGQLHLLEWLNLNDNKLVTLPTTMDQMRKLVKMGVVQNRLKILPAAIARLNLLYKLDVRRNEIEYLPSAFKEMQRIHSLLLEENPLSVKYGVVNYERQPPSLLELASRAVLENYCPQDEESVPFSSCAQTSSSMGSIDTAAENLVPMMSNLGMSKPLPPLPSPHQIPITQKSRHSFFSRGSSTIHPQQIKSTRSETLAPTCSSDSSSTASSSSPTTISPLSAHGNMVSPTATPPPGQSAEKQKSSPCSIRPSLFCRSSQNQQSKTHAVGHIQQPSTSTTSILAGKVSPSSTAATRRMNLVPKIDCLLDPEVSILPITLIDHLSIPTTACDYCSRRMFTSGWIDFLEPAKLGSARMIIPVRHRMCSMQCVRQQHRDTFGTELSELFESTDFHIGSNEEMIGSRPIIPEELDEYMIEAVQEAAQAAGISVAHLLEQYQQSQQAQSQQQQQQDQQEGAEDGTILPSVPQEAMPGSPPTNVFGNTLNAQQTMSSGPTSVNRQTAARLCRSISRPMPPIEIQVDPQGQLRRVVYRENKNNTGPRGRIFGPFSTLSQVNGQGEIGTLAATGLGGNTTNNSNTNNGNAGSTGGSRAPGETTMTFNAGEASSSNGNDIDNDNTNDNNSNKKYTSPFAQFDITSTDVLDTIEKKHCPTCNKNVRYFCSKCLKLVNCPEGSVPQLKLPIKIDVIKHENERDGKSTALHAKILAPDDVEVYGWKSMPRYENVDRLLLLFPSPGAKTLSEIDPSSFDKLVVIDGTWEQANKMSKSDSPLVRMKRVTIAPHETLFWRHQRKTDDHLATIEAIYYFLREYHETYLSAIPDPVLQVANDEEVSILKRDSESNDNAGVSESSSEPGATAKKVITPHKEWIDSQKLGPYTNQFDDMLWFYKYFYELIQRTYRERTDGREFTLRHKKGYINYDADKNVKGNEGNEEKVEENAMSLSSSSSSTSAVGVGTNVPDKKSDSPKN